MPYARGNDPEWKARREERAQQQREEEKLRKEAEEAAGREYIIETIGGEPFRREIEEAQLTPEEWYLGSLRTRGKSFKSQYEEPETQRIRREVAERELGVGKSLAARGMGTSGYARKFARDIESERAQLEEKIRQNAWNMAMRQKNLEIEDVLTRLKAANIPDEYGESLREMQAEFEIARQPSTAEEIAAIVLGAGGVFGEAYVLGTEAESRQRLNELYERSLRQGVT